MQDTHTSLNRAFTSGQLEIADATLRVIAQQGFDVVSVRTVAQACGITAGTVQYHFPSRKELLIGALIRSVQRQGQRIDAVERTGVPLDDLCTTMSELLPTSGVQREDAAAWVSFGAAASTRDYLAPIYQEALEAFRAGVFALLERLQKAGFLQPGITPRSGAHLVTALVNGLTIDHLNASPDQRADLENALRIGLGFIVRA